MLVLLSGLFLVPPTRAEPGPTLVLVGDVNFAGYEPEQDPFVSVAPLLAADLKIANAEGLLVASAVPKYRESRLDISAPPAHARHLAAFDLIGLANNHTWDAGAKGLTEHLATFAAHGLQTIGAGLSREAAYAPRRYAWRDGHLSPASDASPPCVSVLAAATKSNRPPEPGAFAALARTDTERKDVLARVQAEHGRGCFVVVSLHTGREGTTAPAKATRAFGLALVKAGAGLVAAHHPHVLHGVELIPTPHGGAAIAWSLGNFLFKNRTPEKRMSGVLKARLEQHGADLSLAGTELLLTHSDESLRPRPATSREAQAIARLVTARSRAFGTLATLMPAPARLTFWRDLD